MLRPPDKSAFDIHLSSAAWAELGRLSRDEYEQVKSELRRVAQLADATSPAATARPMALVSRCVLCVGRHVLEYRVDRFERRICLDAIGTLPAPWRRRSATMSEAEV